jgi:hypothetical protein
MTAKKKAAKRYPPLPSEVQGAGGTITVQLVKSIPGGEPGEDTLGQFEPSTRHVLILKTLRGDQQWMVLFHELAHAALWDSGAHNALAGTVEELVCDAIACSRLREKFP